MINIKKAMKSNRLMKSLTGLKLQQFRLLVHSFEIQLKKYFKNKRKVNINIGRQFTLKSTEEKLFYILFYMKCYPTYDLAGFIFGVDKSTTCRWTHWFMDALEKTLSKKKNLPKRQIRTPEEIMIMAPNLQEIYIDGTERPRRRPSQKKLQKKYYSGKKKRHTMKNIIVSDKNKNILILTTTKEGKLHDYANFKQSKLGNHLPRDIPIIVDNGFQGIQKDYPEITVEMPKRKPKGKKLSKKETERNKKISSNRVVNEHAIGGVKRLRIVSDVYRNIKKGFDDKVMLNACGIWNFYLETT